VNRAAVVAALLAGCTSFPDPDIVVDLRVMALAADRPEQVVDVDLNDPEMPAELLQQLKTTQVCALVADPAFARRLRYTLTLCPYGDYYRCDVDVQVPIGSGIIDDPDSTRTAPQLCATVPNSQQLLGVVLHTLKFDALGGLGGIDYMIGMSIGGEDADPALDLFASKALRVSPRIPMARRANLNPSLDGVDASINGAPVMSLDLARCADTAPALEIRAGDTIRLTPLEAAGAREEYVVPTLDGMGRMFTESLTYQWSASAGGFSAGSTGGPRDVAGNPAPLFTDWHAPNARDLAGPTDVTLWIIQRDERLGVHWYETCVRVVP
jgi:hypothetical protein